MATMRGPAWLAAGAALAMTAGAAAGGCSSPKGSPPTQVSPTHASPLPTPPSIPTPTVAAQAGERRPEPVSFLVRAGGCERFAEAVRAVAVEAVGPYGFTVGSSSSRSGGLVPTTAAMMPGAMAPTAGGTAAPQAGVDFSTTNVQEAGVDEPDTVKTDGRLLVSTVDGRVRVLDVAGEPRLLGNLDLEEAAGRLLLVGDQALVLSSGSGPPSGGTGAAGSLRPTTIVTVVDLKDPAKPTLTRTHTIDGGYVDARLVGGVARIVTRSSPDVSFPHLGGGGGGAADAKATEANADVVRRAAPSAFLPRGASCDDAYVPAEPSGVGTIAVQSVDPAAEKPGPAVTVVAEASTVYASRGRLFIATNRYASTGTGSGAATFAAGTVRTAIHAFDITDPVKARYAGSGDAPGRLLNQFSLSEHDGVLRVATTIDGRSPDGGRRPLTSLTTQGNQGQPVEPGIPSESRVSILRPAGAEWVEVGAVEGLGKGERIYAVRFLGATGYVVTFRQVDPLYVLDLRDNRSPKMTGELKITGYSAYLHPAGDGRLLGIGQEATVEGQRAGTQLSLFDVADPAAPAKLAGAVLPQGSSAAERDHHAFLYWAAKGLVVAPVTTYDPRGTGAPARRFVGAVAFRVGDRAVTEAARITHPGSTPIQRSLVVGERLLTVSQVGLATNDLSSLADGGFVPFR